MLWQLVHGSATWTEYFHAKYIKNTPLSCISISPGASHSWRSMLRKNVFLQHTLYIIHRGSISFWDDPWLEDYGPLRTYVSADLLHLVPTNEISIKDYLAPNGQWRLTSLQPILPPDIISAASALVALLFSVSIEGEYHKLGKGSGLNGHFPACIHHDIDFRLCQTSRGCFDPFFSFCRE